MNSGSEEEQGGVKINPSARRPIHNNYTAPERRPIPHNNILPISDNMGRYGMDKSNSKNERENTSSHNNQGVDEVDNVMSKMSRHASPLPIRKKNLQRTNSYSQDEDDPTSSDDSEYEANYSASRTHSRLEDTSHHSPMMNRSDRNTVERSYHNQDSEQRETTNKLPYIMISLVAVISMLYYYYNTPVLINHEKATQTENYDDLLFENNMKNLQEKYNIDNDSILKLKTGISIIFSRMDAGSFIFLYNSTGNNFDAVRFRKFTNEVAFTTARYLRNNIKSIHQSIVEGSDLDMHEHSELMNRYRDDVDKTGVLLVREVDEIPSDLAMAFHYYCDEYDPLVKRSAIFFTLNLANCTHASAPKSIHDFIEKCLERKWTTVPPENIRPLLTRVVDTVIDVTSVF